MGLSLVHKGLRCRSLTMAAQASGPVAHSLIPKGMGLLMFKDRL